MRLKAIISLWISLIVLGNCEHRADYLNWSRKVANYCKYVKYSEESKRYECGPKLGEFYAYIIIHPDYILPKNPIYPLVAYDGNDNVVMVGGNGRGQIWRMIKFEKWAFVRETKTGMKEVYYDEDEGAFIGLEIGDNKEDIKSKAWWSKDGGKSWVRAKVPLFNKKEENKANSVLSVPPVVELTPKATPTTSVVSKVAPKTPVLKPLAPTPVLKPLAPTLVVGPTAPPKPFVAPKPKLPVGGIAEAVGGGYAVAIGKVGGKPAVWRSIEKVPRDWKLTEKFSGGRILPDSLTELSQLKGVEFKGGKFQIRDEEGQGWTYNDTKNKWELTESGGFAGGSGTASDPYQIASAIHLWLVRNHSTSHFELIQDIDLSVVTEKAGFAPIGSGWSKRFRGTFDGKGKVIRKLKINRRGNRYVGLFGWVGGKGVVKNIGLEDINVTGGNYVGGLAGDNEGTIENSYATGTVTGNNLVGGLVGDNGGRIEKSYAMANVVGQKNVGGLVGFNWEWIENSYATGNVRGSDRVSGLAGGNNKKVVNSYATGNVRGSSRFGGLIGHDQLAGKISGKNYWKKGTTAKGVGVGSRANVIEQTEAQLKALDAGETGWSDKIWNFKAGEYPKLKWQTEGKRERSDDWESGA